VSRFDDLLVAALKELPEKPADTVAADVKKAYSEKLSARVAVALSEGLRDLGMKEARPSGPGDVSTSGAERQMSGGIGAKKVDVTWSTEESGLLLGISIKSINFRDSRTKNFQKNLTNRRGDMLFEAVTLHRRFPYAVLVGFFFFDKDAAADESANRNSTFMNAHQRFRIFTGRNDPAGRDEQYERLYIILVDANRFDPKVRVYLAGKPDEEQDLGAIAQELLELIAERNPDFYEVKDGKLRKTARTAGKKKLGFPNLPYDTRPSEEVSADVEDDGLDTAE
jgi:hypothetical protein